MAGKSGVHLIDLISLFYLEEQPKMRVHGIESQSGHPTLSISVTLFSDNNQKKQLFLLPML